MKYYDVILNKFVGDLWLVDYISGNLKLCLVPNSGYIGHPRNEYPAHVEDLDIVDDCPENWQKLGNFNEKPELLEGLNYEQTA
jgi:hypothetical protein